MKAAWRTCTTFVVSIALLLGGNSCAQKTQPIEVLCSAIQERMNAFLSDHRSAFEAQRIYRIPASHGFPCDMSLRVRGNPFAEGRGTDNEYIDVVLFIDHELESMEWSVMIAGNGALEALENADTPSRVSRESVEEYPEPATGQYVSYKEYYRIQRGYILHEVRSDIGLGARFTPEAVELVEMLQKEFPPVNRPRPR